MYFSTWLPLIVKIYFHSWWPFSALFYKVKTVNTNNKLGTFVVKNQNAVDRIKFLLRKIKWSFEIHTLRSVGAYI